MEPRKLIALLFAFSLCLGMAPATLVAVAEEVAQAVAVEEAAPSGVTEDAAPSDATEEAAPSGVTEDAAPSDATEEAAPSDATEDAAPSDVTEDATPSKAMKKAERKAVADMAALSAAYPNKFDPRDRGVVTPVKCQDPFGACWSFAGIAAAETSALTTLGMTFDERKEQYGRDFDLSEKRLVWYAVHPITELSNPEQAGEGLRCVKEDIPNAVYANGGSGTLITSLFAAGIGPVAEDAFPYQGKEGFTQRDMVCNQPERIKEFLRATAECNLKMTLEEAVERLKKEPEKAAE